MAVADPEWETLRRCLQLMPPPPEAAGLVLGALDGDDCALLRLDGGRLLAVSTDASVEGRHFLQGSPWHAVGHRAVAVALSDLAAMGAQPLWATTSVALPDHGGDALPQLAGGMAECLALHGCTSVGGDTVMGQALISVQVAGEVPQGQELRRSGALPGQLLCLTGRIGGARLGLRQWQQQGRPDPAGLDEGSAMGRYWRPQPRIGAGLALRGLATAAIDISDGLLLDCQRLAERSGCALHLRGEQVPLHPECQAGGRSLEQCLRGGDDYELAFTLPPDRWERAQQALAQAGVEAAAIGHCQEGCGLHLDGQDLSAASDLGWNALE